jgi:hypothetical protein
VIVSNVNTPNGYQPLYNSVATGSITVGTTNTQLAAAECGMVCLQADAGNAAAIYLNAAPGDTTGGFRLDAGQSTPWMAVDNLNRLYAYSANAAQTLRYLILK